MIRRPDFTGSEPCMQTDPALFTPEQFQWADARIARWLCGRCELQVSCLEWAVSDPSLDGIYGGTTKPERQQIRARRASSNAAKTHCPRGHEYTGDNVQMQWAKSRGGAPERVCRACRSIRRKKAS